MQSKERLPWTCIGPGGPRARPTAPMLAASQPVLRIMMHEETGKFLELRRDLDKEMELISEDYISSHHLETETFLAHIKKLKMITKMKLTSLLIGSNQS